MKLRKNEVIMLFAIVFLGFFAYALTITLFVPMLMDKSFALLENHSTTSIRVMTAGFLLAMYPFGQFVGSPIIGKLSDHYGRKKMLELTLSGCFLGFIAIAVSIQYHQLALLFISCFFTGLCDSNMAISQSIIADNTTDDALKKTKFIAYIYSVCSLGYIVGPLAGGLGATVWGYSSPFWISAIGILGLTIWVKTSFSTHHVASSEPIRYWEALTSIKTVNKKPKIYFTNFLIFFAVFGLYRLAPLYVADTWNPPLPLYSFLISYVSTLCLLANLFLTSRLAKRFSTQKLLSGLLFVGGVSIIVIVLPKQFNWIWLTYGFAVIPTVMALTVCTSWLSSRMTKKEQGQALGNNHALLVLGESSSALIGGLLAALIIPLPVVVMGIILIVACFMVLYDKTPRVEAQQ